MEATYIDNLAVSESISSLPRQVSIITVTKVRSFRHTIITMVTLQSILLATAFAVQAFAGHIYYSIYYKVDGTTHLWGATDHIEDRIVHIIANNIGRWSGGDYKGSASGTSVSVWNTRELQGEGQVQSTLALMRNTVRINSY